MPAESQQVKFKSTIFAQASGSLAGKTFSRNKGGMYVRARGLVKNPNTPAQQVVRTALKALTTAWVSTLSATQQTQWATYASNVPLLNTLGDSRSIPALAMFVRCNSGRLIGGLAVVANGPTTFSVANLTTPVPTVSHTTGLSTAYTNTDVWANAVGGALLIFVSKPQNQSINFFKGPFNYAAKVAGAATPPTSPLVTTYPYTLTAGQKVFIRYIATNADGRLSADVIQATTVV